MKQETNMWIKCKFNRDANRKKEPEKEFEVKEHN